MEKTNQNLLQKLTQILNVDKIISPEDIEAIRDALIGVLANNKKELESLTDETKQAVNSILDKVLTEHDTYLEKTKQIAQEAKSETTEAINSTLKSLEEVKALCKEVMECKPENGEDADEEYVIGEVLNRIKLPEYKEIVLDDGSAIVDKINSLPVNEENQIDAKHIKNLPEGKGGRVISGGVTRKIVEQMIAASGGGGSPGGSTAQLQYNNAGAFGGISGATTDGTAVTYTTGNLKGADVKASSSAGFQILSNAGTVTSLHGAGGGANNTFYGGIKGDYLTASELTITDATKNLVSAPVATYPSLTELTYVKGVTSDIQTQLNSKGTFTLPSLTSGSVLFSNGTTIAQDNPNFFWDDTNNRVGILTTSPAVPLHVSANNEVVRVGDNTNANNYIAFAYNTGAGSPRAMIGHNSVSGNVAVQGGTSKGIEFNVNNGTFGSGTAMTLLSTGLLGIGTTAPTHTLTLPSTSTGIALYNTADQTTNYERVRAFWSANVFTIDSQNGGTGTLRAFALQAASTNYIVMAGSNAKLDLINGLSTGFANIALLKPTATASSSVQNIFAITPTINQSTTAGYTALLVNPTETTVGNGTKLLADFQVGGVSKFSVTNAAVTTISNTSGQTMTFSPVLGGANFPGIELLTTAGNGSFFRANTTSGVQLDMLSNAAVSGIIRTNNSYPLELRTNNTVGLTISTAQVGTFANNSIITANAITATANAATIPVTKGRNIVTNNSAATLTITLTTSGAVNMQTVIVQILDFSAAAQTLTFVNTENSTVSVPATTNGSTTLPLTVGFIYNASTSKWRCIASA